MLASLTHPCSGAFCDLELSPSRYRNVLDCCHLLPKIQNHIIWCENLTLHVMGGGMVFRPIIRSHQCSQAPIKYEFFLLTPWPRSQWKRMSMAFVPFGWTHKLTMLSAVELSVWTGVGGCKWLISSKILRSSTPFHAFIYNAPISASAAEDITDLIMDASL